MKILVINCGSTTLKYQLIDSETEKVYAKGLCERIGIADADIAYTSSTTGEKKEKKIDMPDHSVAFQAVIDVLLDPVDGAVKSLDEIDAVGHRVVHGGEFFDSSVVINDEVIAKIKECSDLAPLHNPANLLGIDACSKLMPGTPQCAVFDTAFHQTMPEEAYIYGIPFSYYENYKIRRYGFHGTSHSFVSKRAIEILGKPVEDSKVIVCHLGGGASITAVKGGKSVDTSMGLTPLEGLIMGTRSGNIDPAIIQYIANKEGKSIDEIDKQKSQTEALVGNWKDKLHNQQTLIQKRGEELKSDVKNSIRSNVDAQVDDFNIIANNSEGNPDDLNRILNERLTKASSSINSSVENLIQEAANSVCKRVGEEMMSIGSELQTIGLDGDCTFDMSVARDYTERQKSIDEEFMAKVEQINEIKENVNLQENLSNQAKADLELAISQAEQEILSYKSNIEAITNSYEPQYVDRQSQLGSIGKSIGNVLDIAMLFIPSSGWLKAGKWVSKIGKSGSTIRKVGEALGTGAKILAKTDAAKDAATLLGGLKNASDRVNGNMKKTSVFDYVSLSYWFEKAGELLDPSTCELDKQYEQQFLTRKSEAEAVLKDALDKKKEMIANLAKLNGEKWKSEQELAEAEKMNKTLIRETEAIKAKLESEKTKAIRESLISQAKSMFEKRINEYAVLLSGRTSDMIDTVFSSIINAADLKISTQLNSLTEQLTEIASNREEFTSNRDTMIAHYDDMSSKLKFNMYDVS